MLVWTVPRRAVPVAATRNRAQSVHLTDGDEPPAGFADGDRRPGHHTDAACRRDGTQTHNYYYYYWPHFKAAARVT